MAAAVDHVFLCTEVGAPGADILRQFGLSEGTRNRHPGQGTACRRFFFRNAMFELIWVENREETRSPESLRTRLWERWSSRGRGASPFGVILRPATGSAPARPFPSWEYRPSRMPDLILDIATDTGINEPMWCYMPRGLPPAEWPAERRQPLEHPCGFHDVTQVRLICPPLAETSLTRAMAKQNIIALETGNEHLLELEFDEGRKGGRADFRPALPLVFRW